MKGGAKKKVENNKNGVFIANKLVDNNNCAKRSKFIEANLHAIKIKSKFVRYKNNFSLKITFFFY